MFIKVLFTLFRWLLIIILTFFAAWVVGGNWSFANELMLMGTDRHITLEIPLDVEPKFIGKAYSQVCFDYKHNPTTLTIYSYCLKGWE